MLLAWSPPAALAPRPSLAPGGHWGRGVLLAPCHIILLCLPASPAW